MNTYLTLANLHTREKPIGVCTFRLPTGCLGSILSLSRLGQHRSSSSFLYISARLYTRVLCRSFETVPLFMVVEIFIEIGR